MQQQKTKNMKTINSFLIYFFFLAISAHAQTNFVNDYIDNATEQQKAERENRIQDWIAKENNGTRQIVYIPLVVHVIYNAAYPDVTDQFISDQVDLINLNFLNQNALLSQVPLPFRNISASANIQFCIADRDPSGNPAYGIIHKETSQPYWYIFNLFGNDSMKYTSMGGDDAWDTHYYMNIWIAPLIGFPYGYAYSSSSHGSTSDGIVMKTGNFLAESVSHEIGHYFNLIHVWGDDGGACTGTDNVTDTPNQGDLVYSGTYPMTDACTTVSPGIILNDYMQYTSVKYMFTQGQITRMNAALNTGRTSLLSSNGCQGLSSIENENLQSLISIVPNPASDELTVEILNGLALQQIEIANELGVTVMKLKQTKLNQQLNIKSLASGVYFIKVLMQNGNVVVKKFIKE